MRHAVNRHTAGRWNDRSRTWRTQKRRSQSRPSEAEEKRHANERFRSASRGDGDLFRPPASRMAFILSTCPDNLATVRSRIHARCGLTRTRLDEMVRYVARYMNRPARIQTESGASASPLVCGDPHLVVVSPLPQACCWSQSAARNCQSIGPVDPGRARIPKPCPPFS